MGGLRIWGGAALAVAALLAGCDNGPSAVARQERQAASAGSEAPRSFASVEPRGERDTVDHRAEAPMKVGGGAGWAATKRYSAEEGAQRAFERNGEDFGAANVEAFVRKAHAFVSDPPAGVETLERPNGDTLYYDAKANVFAVANKDGLPKTMFKPDEGAAYWTEQKTRDSRRETARRRSGEEKDEG
jgi:pyocin large subunit-like protein